MYRRKGCCVCDYSYTEEMNIMCCRCYWLQLFVTRLAKVSIIVGIFCLYSYNLLYTILLFCDESVLINLKTLTLYLLASEKYRVI